MCDLFFFKQMTAYEMRISDWSSDVCSSDLRERADRTQPGLYRPPGPAGRHRARAAQAPPARARRAHRHLRRARRGRVPHQRTRQHRIGPGQPRRPARRAAVAHRWRSETMTTSKSGKDKATKKVAKQRTEEHTSELQSLMRISYADFGLK